MEGLPEVVVVLAQENEGNNYVIKNYTVHPCVTNTDFDTSHKFNFNPPLNEFELVKYSVERKQLPLRGYYQMKARTSPLTFLLSLYHITLSLV